MHYPNGTLNVTIRWKGGRPLRPRIGFGLEYAQDMGSLSDVDFAKINYLYGCWGKMEVVDFEGANPL